MLSMNRLVIPVFFVLVFASLIPYAEGVSVSIETDKQTYYFGDHLTFAVTVDEITKELAMLVLIDGNGKRSSVIPIPIYELNTVETSPFPFDKLVYPEGKWVLEIEYDGVMATTEFFVKDSGQIIIPAWIKDIGKMWANDLITDEYYITAIEFLIREDIIIIPEIESSEGDKKIPQWVKALTGWWSEDMISDHEYAKSLEYLIKVGVIVV